MHAERSGLTTHVATLTTAGAKLVLAAAEAAARDQGCSLSLSVVDRAGNLLAFLRSDAAPPSSVEASLRKARSAALLGSPTRIYEDLLHGGMTSLLAYDSVTPSRGGVPLLVGGVCLGAVGGSGGSGAQDEAAAEAGAAALAAALAEPVATAAHPG
jgi:glc operon protein GlcG